MTTPQALHPDATRWLASEEALARIRQEFVEIHERPKDQQDQPRLTDLRRQAVEVHYARIHLLLTARKPVLAGL